MNEKYLRSYFDTNIAPNKADATYEDWVSKISTNEEYKSNMFKTHVASKKPDADYNDWNTKVFGSGQVATPEKKNLVGTPSQAKPLQGLGGVSEEPLQSFLVGQGVLPSNSGQPSNVPLSIEQPLQAAKTLPQEKPESAISKYEKAQSQLSELTSLANNAKPRMHSSGVTLKDNSEYERLQSQIKNIRSSVSEMQPEIDKVVSGMFSDIDNNLESFTTKDINGLPIADTEKAAEFASKKAAELGLPEDGYAWKYIWNKAKDHAAFKIVEPEVNKEFAKSYEKMFGKPLEQDRKDVVEIIGGVSEKVAKADIEIDSFAKTQLEEANQFAEEDLTARLGGLQPDQYVQQIQSAYEQSVAMTNQAFAGKVTPEGFVGNESEYNAYKVQLDQYERQYNDAVKTFKEAAVAAEYGANRRYKRNVQEYADGVYRGLNQDVEQKLKPADVFVQNRIKAAYKDAYGKVAENNEWLKGALGRSAGSEFTSPLRSAVGGSLKAIGTITGSEDMQVYGDYIQDRYNIGSAEIEEWSDWFTDYRKALRSTGQLMGSMSTSMIPAIAVGALTSGAGAAPTYAALAGGSVAFLGETTDLAGRMYDQTFAETGDAGLATERSKKVFDSQMYLAPTYALEMLPFVGKFSGGAAKKFLKGAAMEYATETLLQEYPQNAIEKAIMDDAELSEVYKYMSFEDLNNTAKNTVGVIAMGGLGQLKQHYAEEQEQQANLEKNIKSLAAKAALGKVTEAQAQETILNIVANHGVQTADAVISAAFNGNEITYEQASVLLSDVKAAEEYVKGASELGLSDQNAYVFTNLRMKLREAERQAENEQDPAMKSIKSKRAGKLKKDMEDMFNGGETRYTTLTYPNGTFQILTYDEARKKMKEEGFGQTFIDGELKFEAFGNEAQELQEELKGILGGVGPAKETPKAETKPATPVAETPAKKTEKPKDYEPPLKFTSPTDEKYAISTITGQPVMITKAEYDAEMASEKPVEVKSPKEFLDDMEIDGEPPMLRKENPIDDVKAILDTYKSMLKDGSYGDGRKGELVKRIEEAEAVIVKATEKPVAEKPTTVPVGVDKPTLEISMPENLFDKGLVELGYEKSDIDKMTMEQKQEIVSNKTQASKSEDSAKVNSVKENAKQQRLAEMNAELDDEAKPTPTAQPFLESLGGTPVKDLSETVAEGVFQTEVDGADVLMSEVDENTVKLESIRVPDGQRKQGKAKAALKKITDEADKQGKAIVLDVVPENEIVEESPTEKSTVVEKGPTLMSPSDDGSFPSSRQIKDSTVTGRTFFQANLRSDGKYEVDFIPENLKSAFNTMTSRINDMYEGFELDRPYESKVASKPIYRKESDGSLILEKKGQLYYGDKKPSATPSKNQVTEEGLRKLYEQAGFVPDGEKSMRREAKEGEVEVKSFKKGEGGTAGVLEGKDGKLYKSAVPHRRDIVNGKVEIVPVEGKETQEHKFLSENQDMKHLPKVGKVVETSQGKAFEIEKLNEVEEGSLTLDEINQIQETLTELNNRGVEVADNNTVMRRDNGEIVLVDLSNAQERNKNDIGETVSSNVVELLSKNDQTRYLANEQSKQRIEELTLFDEAPKPKTEFTYLLTQRPPSIGTHPIGQIRDAEEITLEDGKRKAYKITYDKPLSPEEIKQYELTEDVTMNDVGRIFEKTSGRTLISKLITNVSDKGVSVTTFLGGKAKSETMSRRKFQREIDGYSETSQSNKQTPATATKEGKTEKVSETESNKIDVKKIEDEIAQLRKDRDAYLEDFEIEKAKEADNRIIELSGQLDTEIEQREFTEEEKSKAFDEKAEEERKAFKEGHSFKAIEETFTPISIAEYDRVHGKGMYNQNKKLLKGLVDKEGSKDSIDNRGVRKEDGEVEYFDPADIMDYIDAVAFDRAVSGETKYEVPKNTKPRKKAAPKKKAGEKVSTADFLKKLAEDVRKGKIDKDIMMSGIPGFKQAFNTAVEAAAKTLEASAYVSDIIDAVVAEIKKNKVFMSSLNAAKRKALDFEAMVAKEMGMSKEDYLKDKITAMDKRARERIKEAEKKARGEERQKTTEAKKETTKAKKTPDQKSKDKYATKGFRIGEALGKLAGEIRGKAEGRKEGRKDAAKMQKEFAKGVESMLSEMIAEAKRKSPGFTVSANQFAAASKRLLSVNFNSPISIDRAVDYVEKVLNNATYASDVAKAKKLKEKNRKRLARNDYGIDDGSMSQSLKVDHEQLSVEGLADYLDYLEGISKGPYDKAANIDSVEKYAAVYREQKEAFQEPVSDAQKEANEKRELSRSESKDEAIDEFSFERESMTAPVAEAYQKEYDFLKSLTEEEIDGLSENQIRELSNAIRNMRDGVGFMSGNASNTIREIKAERSYSEAKTVTEGRQFKQLLRDMLIPLKVSLKGIQKMTTTDKMKKLISMMPLNRIDAAMKGVTGERIHDTFIQPISTAFSLFTEKVGKIDSGYDKLYSKVGKSIVPWKREKQRQEEMVKLSLIAIQKEFEANPNNEEVSPLSDYIEAIKEAARIDDDYAKTSEDYIAIYESMLDNDGNFDYVKQEELLDKDTKAFFDYAQSVNASNAEFVEVSAIRNGENVSLRQFYTPISVALIDHSDLSKIQDKANEFSGGDNVKPTAQSGNIKKRTMGGKPLYLDFHSNAKRATRSVLLDYYMREPLRVASKAFNKISKDTEMSADSKAFFKGIEANIAQVVKNVFVNEYFEGGFFEKAKNLIKKRGYQMALSSIPRAGVEFASNLSHVSIFKPIELASGIRSLIKYKGNDGDFRDVAILAESTQISRMFDKSTSVMSEQGVSTKGSSTMYGRMIDQINDSVVSKPDQAIARPLWIGSFLNEFEKLSGSPLDVEKMINSAEYRAENASAIARARKTADSNLSQGFASLNPFEGVVGSQVVKSDSMGKIFDKYMTRFMRYEFQSAADAINGMVGNNQLTKREGAALMAATITRMAAYQFAMSYAMDMFYSLIESALGMEDKDDDDDDKLIEKLNTSIIGAVTTMLVFRRLGNWAKAPIAWGLEILNNKFGEEAGLRSGEYDPYKNSIVFSPVPGDVKKEDMSTDKLISKFMGPYGPMAKTVLRGKELLTRRASSTTQVGIDKADRELAGRIVPELVMGTIGAPVPRDIRNLILRETFKDFDSNKKSPIEQNLSEKQSELETEMDTYKGDVLAAFSKKIGDKYAKDFDEYKIPQASVSEYRKKFKDRYKEVKGESSSLPDLSRDAIVKDHNFDVFFKKDPDIAKHLITTEGEGKTLKLPIEVATSMFGKGMDSLNSSQEKEIKAFLRSIDDSEYLPKLKTELSKLKSKKK